MAQRGKTRKPLSKRRKMEEGLRQRKATLVLGIVVLLVFASILVVVLHYPGSTRESDRGETPYFEIAFPRDEGRHNDSLEFWKIDFLLQNELGEEFSINVDYYLHEIGSPERVASFTDEGNISGTEFTFNVHEGSLSVGFEKLNLSFVSPFGSDRWDGRYTEGFEYSYESQVNDGTGEVYYLDVQMTSQKDPTLLGDEGVITLESDGDFLGTIKGYTITRLIVTGSLRFSGRTHSVTGYAWILHEWGAWSIYDIEQFRLHLSTATELFLFRFFNGKDGEIVKELAYYSRPSGQLVKLGEEDFVLENLRYWIDVSDTAKERCYPSLWSFVAEDVNTEITFHTSIPNQKEKYYWEGSLRVSGKIGGLSGAGRGFALLNHEHYSTLAIEHFYGDNAVVPTLLELYAEVSDGIPVQNVTLYYNVSASGWKSLNMSYLGDGLWKGTIPVSEGEHVKAYAEACDLAGKRAVSTAEEWNI